MYQQWIQAEDLCAFRVAVQETDLLILALEDFSEFATQAVMKYRSQIESYMKVHPEFRTSFQPLEVEAQAPPIIQDMISASKQAGVGPFATVAGAIGILAAMARWTAIFGGMGSSDDEDVGGIFGLLVMAIVAPLAAMLIQMAISRTREYKADKIGARMTGQPLALASALEKLHRAPVRLKLDSRPATAHLFIAKPLSGKGLSNLFSTHPPVEERVRRLQALAGMPNG